jgi:hypothetical protein
LERSAEENRVFWSGALSEGVWEQSAEENRVFGSGALRRIPEPVSGD